MADLDSGDILRIGCGLSFEGIYDVVNVFYVIADLDAGINWAAVTGFVQDWADEVYDNIKATLSDTMSTNTISVANITQVTTLGAIAWSPTWGGSEGGEQTPPGVSCFAWARTYKPRVQIRKYLGVFGEVNLVDGHWSTAVQTACGLFMDDVIKVTTMGTNKTFQGIAYNREFGTHEFGVSTDVSAEPAYQRRRKRGRGS